MLLRFFPLVLVLAVTSATACSSSSDTSTSPPAASGDGGSADGGACGSLAVAAAPVTVEVLAEAPPPARGSTLPNGTFVVTRGVLYVGAAGDVMVKESPLAVALRIDGSRGEILREGVVRAATFATSGSTLTTTGTCPASKVEDVEYTATSDTLVLHVKRGTGTLVETFSRQ